MLVPAMVYLLGMNQHRAHGTSLAAVVFVVLSNAIFYFRGLNPGLEWLVMAIELAVGGIFGAIIGAKLCQVSSACQLRRYFAVIIAVVALRMLGDPFNYFTHDGISLPGLALSTKGFWGTMLALGVGILTGIVSGLLGIGGGVVLVPALVLLLSLEQQLAQAISLAVIVPTSLSGSLIHYRHGNVRVDVWIWLTIGGIVGGLFGSRTAFMLNPMVLRGIFGILLIVVSVIMFRRQGPSQR